MFDIYTVFDNTHIVMSLSIRYFLLLAALQRPSNAFQNSSDISTEHINTSISRIFNVYNRNATDHEVKTNENKSFASGE